MISSLSSRMIRVGNVVVGLGGGCRRVVRVGERWLSTSAAAAAATTSKLAVVDPSAFEYLGRRRPFSSTTHDLQAKKVGFIGLGNMGLPMAMNLVKNNVAVVAYDSNEETKRRALLQYREEQRGEGVGTFEMADSLQDVVDFDDSKDPGGSSRRVVFTMLPGCDAVDGVMTVLRDHIASIGGGGGMIFVDCSTVSPMTSRKWNETWKSFGQDISQKFDFVDAPVSGGVKGAADGTLTFMVGGCEEDDEEDGTTSSTRGIVQSYLRYMGQRSVICGETPGSGSVTKLCNNMALATQMIGICEAINLGEALGVDPAKLCSVVNTSTAACWSSRVNNPHPDVAARLAAEAGGSSAGPPSTRDYEGGFGSQLMLKDLTLAVQAAESVSDRTSAPLTASCKELYKMVALHGMGRQDFGVVLQFLKGRRGGCDTKKP